MRSIILACLLAAYGCSPTSSTKQPEPVPVNRKFFEDSNDPAKGRTAPKPQSKG